MQKDEAEEIILNQLGMHIEKSASKFIFCPDTNKTYVEIDIVSDYNSLYDLTEEIKTRQKNNKNK